MVKLTEEAGGQASSSDFVPASEMGGFAIDSNFTRKMVKT